MFDTFDGKHHVNDQFLLLINQPTIGIDFIAKTFYVEEKTIRLNIWDTAGQERFRSLLSNYLRDCKVAVIVYDVTGM